MTADDRPEKAETTARLPFSVASAAVTAAIVGFGGSVALILEAARVVVSAFSGRSSRYDVP